MLVGHCVCRGCVFGANSIELAVLPNVVGFPRTHEGEAAVTWPVTQPTSVPAPDREV